LGVWEFELLQGGLVAGMKEAEEEIEGDKVREILRS